MSTLRSFFKDTVIYGLATVLPRVISLVLVAVFTAVLGKADFSDQTTWYVYAAFINVILTLGIETSFFRYYTTYQDKSSVLATSFFILLLSSFIFLVTGLALASYAAPLLGFKDVLFIKILVVTTVLDTLVVVPFAYLRVTGRPLKFLMLKLINVTVLFVITVFLLLGVPAIMAHHHDWWIKTGIKGAYTPGVIHIISANLAASFVTLLCLLPEFRKIRWKPDFDLFRKLISYGWPIMVGGIAYVINENMDKLLIQSLMDKDANGIYSACYKLGVFMTLYITAFRMGAEPFFFNNALTANAVQKYSIIMTWFVVLGCFAVLIVTGFVDFFASVIIRNKIYHEGLFIVPVILVANLLSGIYNNLAIWYKLTDKTRFGMYISIFGAFVTIGSLLVFVPLLGIMGGAVATLCTYSIMAAISWYFGHKYYPVPYELSKILMMIMVTSVLSYVSFTWFRGSFLFNGGIIILFSGLIAVMEYPMIKNIWRTSILKNK